MDKHDSIKMYGLSTCFHCKALTTFLKEQGLNFEVINVDELLGFERREIIKEVKRINQRCSFPTTVIGERVVVGFKEDDLRETLGI